MKTTCIVACVLASVTAASAEAATVTVNLGLSNETFTLYGKGETSPGSGIGTFSLGQGAATYNPVTNSSTFTLTGTIASGSPGYTTGAYSFVTTYAGQNTPTGGPNAPRAQSDPSNLNFFFYTFLDPSTSITAYLTTPSGVSTVPLVTGGQFVANTGFSFTYPNASCTGVATCTQNNVGITPGATEFGRILTSITFDNAATPPAVPEPATWGLMIAGFGLVGGAMRRRVRTVNFARA